MDRKKVLIFGTTGMLGSAVSKIFKENDEFEVFEINRKDIDFDLNKKVYGEYYGKLYDIYEYKCKGPDFVINCMGMTKPTCERDDFFKPEKIIAINSIFPYLLADISNLYRSKVIQIATDCVFSGKTDSYYDEDSIHDDLTMYGKTKSMGEVMIYPESFYNLRCSIIGPQFRSHKYTYLYEFLKKGVLDKKKGEKVEIPGYTNHVWNGITTIAFAKICRGIVRNYDDIKSELKPLLHIVPYIDNDMYKKIIRNYGNMKSNHNNNKFLVREYLLDENDYNHPIHLNKYFLLKCILEKLKEYDERFINASIVPVEDKENKNMLLSTLYDKFVQKLWKLAGYEKCDYEVLIDELVRYDYQNKEY